MNIKDDTESVGKNIRINQKINIKTDKIVQGVRIAEMFEDKAVFTFHALAILDRNQASSNIRAEMNRLDKETESELSRSQQILDPLLSMAALNKAMVLQQERLRLQNNLKVIDLGGKGSPSQWSIAELRSEFENALINLRIATAIEKDPLGGLAQAVKSAMGNAGFPAVNESAAYTLVSSLDVQDLGLQLGWYWLRAKLSIKLVEAGGKVRGRKQWSLKTSALQRTESESRLMTQVSNKLNAELKSTMIEFSTGVH